MPKKSSKAGKTRTVHRTLADGTVKAYTYAAKAKPRRTRYEPNTVAALMLAYQNSPEWRALAEQTQRTYSVYLADLHRIKALPVVSITKRGLLEIRDAIAATRGNGAGTGFARAASAIFGFAVDRDWLAHNPMAGAKPLQGGELAAWTEPEARLAMRMLPEALRRAVVLAYHTGQRRTDLVRLPWGAYDGRSIRLRQQKGGAKAPLLVLPVHPELKAELDTWGRTKDGETILTAPRGRAWGPQRLSHDLPPALEEIGIARRITIHGLRKLAATRLAEAGCSAHEIAAITGHKTLSMVQHYTKSVDQERMADAAVERLQTSAKDRKRRASG